MMKKILPYLFHVFALSLGYFLLMALSLLVMFPFMGPYSLMMPMLIWYQGASAFFTLFVCVIFLKDKIESDPFKYFKVLTGFTYLLYISPIVMRSFTHIELPSLDDIALSLVNISIENIINFTQHILMRFVIPLVFSAICIGIYIFIIKFKGRKNGEYI